MQGCAGGVCERDAGRGVCVHDAGAGVCVCVCVCDAGAGMCVCGEGELSISERLSRGKVLTLEP